MAAFESHTSRIRLISQWMATVTVVIAAIGPLGEAWLAFFQPDQAVASHHLAKLGITTLGATDRALLFANGVVFMLPGLWGLLQLRGLFRCYAEGEVFSPAATRYLSRFALALLLDALASNIGRTTEALLLTMHLPPGHRILTFGIGSDDVWSLFLGTTLMVVAWVMADAAKAAEENRGFL